MSRTIVVTGALGFVASRLIPRIVARGDRTVGLVRPGRNPDPLRRAGAEVRYGDLSVAGTLEGVFDDATGIVHLAGLALVPTMIPSLLRARGARGVYVSSAGVHTRLPSRGAEEKRAGERALADAGLDFVILRPSMIYGTPDDRNLARLLAWVARFPVVPLPGGGATLQQPVHVDDLCDAILAALERREPGGRAYDVGGPEPLSLARVVEVAAGAMGRRVWTPHVPLGPVHAVARVLRTLHLPSPVRPEQVLRLHESKAVDITPAVRDLGFAPRSFEAGIRAEADALRRTSVRS